MKCSSTGPRRALFLGLVLAVSSSLAVAYPAASAPSEATASRTQVDPPPNDDFADAAPVIQQSFDRSRLSVSFPNVVDAASARLATVEASEDPTPLLDGPGEHSIWYRWTPTYDGDAVIRVRLGASSGCYSGQTGLEVATGTGLTDLDLVAADYEDVDGNFCDTVQVDFGAVRDTTYYIRIDSRDGIGPVRGSIDITPDCETSGTEGDDVIIGTPGADVLCGLGGDDVIIGSGGDDVIDGGAGTDTISYVRADQAVDVTLIYRVATGQGDDTLEGFENITGSGYDDRLEANSLDSVVKGRRGDDVLIGNDGRNELYGRAGNDTLVGGFDSDFLGGGAGLDTCDGDYGVDRSRACESRSNLP